MFGKKMLSFLRLIASLASVVDSSSSPRIKVAAVLYPLTRVKTFSKSSTSSSLNLRGCACIQLTKRQLCRLPHEFYIRIPFYFWLFFFLRLTIVNLDKSIQFYGSLWGCCGGWLLFPLSYTFSEEGKTLCYGNELSFVRGYRTLEKRMKTVLSWDLDLLLHRQYRVFEQHLVKDVWYSWFHNFKMVSGILCLSNSHRRRSVRIALQCTDY